MSAPDIFGNDEVDPATLPDWRAVRLHGVAPAFMPYAVLVALLFWGIAALGAFIGLRVAAELSIRDALLPTTPILLAACWFAALARLDAKRRGWAIREHDLIYRSGVIWQRVVVLPFARIQHVETSSGPLERSFGLLRMKCFTAGGAAGDLTVKGLDVAGAERVREYLLQQIRDDTEADADADAGAGAGAGADAEDHPHGSPASAPPGAAPR